MPSGFNQSFLETNLERKLRDNFDQKKCAGAMIRVTRDGETCFEQSMGYADLESKKELRSDSIFRIYSMSKPITMTAIMQLYERGLVYPEDQVCDYFPAVKDMPVAVEHEDGTVTYEKQQSPVTVKQLYTMTSGVSYPGDDDAGARSILASVEKHGGEEMTLTERVNIVAAEGALSFQPGARWKYGFGHDVIGALVEKISGMKYGEYLRQNIFEPLHMTDTAFWVPQEKRDRFVTPYTVENGEYKSLKDDPEFNEQYQSEPCFESGGGGLVSTVDDYARFAQMLLGGGELEEMMATNQLTREQMKTFGWRDRGYGYGVGMRTHLRPWVINGSVGEFGWDGMMGTWMVVDPNEAMTVVYLQNMFPYNNNGMRLMPIVYAAME